MKYTTKMIKNYVVNVGKIPLPVNYFLKSLGCTNTIYKYPDNYYQALYSIVLSLKPSIVFETGVQNGKSSSAILNAMNENNHGLLVSIDIDACEKHIVPLNLTKRWEFHQGNSKDIINDLIQQKGKIDMFLHDSKHDFNTMYYEYSVAWPYIKQGGLLLSHDIARNKAFKQFARHQSRSFYYMYGNFAGIKK